MSEHCHHHGHESFEGASGRYKKILVLVAVINLAMFLVEAIGGQLAGSVAVQADALDFFADFLTYVGSWIVIGRAADTRANVAMLKGASLAVMGLYVFGAAFFRAFVQEMPEAMTMGAIGFLALAANAASVFLLYKWREGDANVRSVWLCSRNDAIGNVAVMVAAGLVGWMGSAWPDVLVAGLMAALFLSSSWQIIRQALHEKGSAKAPPCAH